MRLGFGGSELDGLPERSLGALEDRDFLLLAPLGRGDGDEAAAQAPEGGRIGLGLDEAVELLNGELEILSVPAMQVEAVDLGPSGVGA